MDQKRAGLRAVGRRRYLRIWAAILSFCVLLTALPSPSATLTVFAASEETDISPDDGKIPGGGITSKRHLLKSGKKAKNRRRQMKQLCRTKM